MFNLTNKKPVEIIVIGNRTIKIIYEDGMEVLATKVIFSVMSDPELAINHLNFFVDGAGNSLGVAGIEVSEEFPLKYEGTLTSDIEEITNYLITNLNG